MRETHAMASHCEAKKHSFRQTQDGVVVSFVLHPSEVPANVALAPLGTRYMLAFAKIGDDEQPESAGRTPAAESNTPPSVSAASSSPDQAPPRQRRRWNEMPPSQRAAILCNDPIFQEWIAIRNRGSFDITENEDVRKEDAAKYLRGNCGVHSRADLNREGPAQTEFLKLEESYLVSVGRLVEPR